MNNRIKSGFKNVTDETFAECLNGLTKQFVKTVIGSAIAFFVLGMIFTDATEENEE